MGRITYELFEAYWPAVARNASGTSMEVAFARRLDEIPKYLISRTRKEAHWPNSFIIGGDLAREVSRLKETEGKDLVTLGTPGLGAALARLGLIDEYHLVMQPIVAGHEPRLFEGIGERLDLELAGIRRFSSGAVLLRYAPRARRA